MELFAARVAVDDVQAAKVGRLYLSRRQHGAGLGRDSLRRNQHEAGHGHTDERGDESLQLATAPDGGGFHIGAHEDPPSTSALLQTNLILPQQSTYCPKKDTMRTAMAKIRHAPYPICQ